MSQHNRDRRSARAQRRNELGHIVPPEGMRYFTKRELARATSPYPTASSCWPAKAKSQQTTGSPKRR